ncbi:MAG: bifunctional shikimate kinase/3-dehydroquinate synthase [Acidobacteriota bacterium]|nr:bifunctional shikimate kinase/3-dehydroquinate synthase [Acidobacteriota bacterium]MDQ7087978.1 bifunctional shikimate kinase/3-dehydroquinate synthase [Acidobacteriota bacterium]
MSRIPRPLVLAGPMGAGKSTVGRILAGWLGVAWADLDAEICRREGADVPTLFARGEAVFRRAESRAARAWLAENAASGGVLALGGGTLEDPATADALEQVATLVHLDADVETLLARLTPEELRARPLLADAADPRARLDPLLRRRAPGYGRAALRIDTTGMVPADVALDLLRALYDPSEGPWSLTPREAGPGVWIGRGLCRVAAPSGAVLLVDADLPAGHRRALSRLEAAAGGTVLRISRRGGEGCKTPQGLLEAWRELHRAGVDKDRPFWVVGGGTISDLGGLVAHTYKRGLELHLFPTTLLAQLDAALGGKNGINLEGTKNAVGTIRLPASVQIDPLYLLSLPVDQLREGLAEAVKSALIGDPRLLTLLEDRAEALLCGRLDWLEEVMAAAAAVKLEVVGQDLHEAGRRHVLNLGHTLGHALESLARARDVAFGHGQAVAVGLVFAARLAGKGALAARIAALLEALGLPARLPEWARGETEALVAALGQDKKRRGGENLWILPEAVGEVRRAVVDGETVRAALGDWR